MQFFAQGVGMTTSPRRKSEISPILAVGPNQNDKGWSGSWVMCDVAIEHAHSLQSFMNISNRIKLQATFAIYKIRVRVRSRLGTTGHYLDLGQNNDV